MYPEDRSIPADPAASRRPLRVKFFGVGGAGCNALEHLANAGFAEIDFTAINTDLQALHHCQVRSKYQLGRQLTRGLGAGGDPAVARKAVEQEAEQLRELCLDRDIVFIVAGLGGGTGTGATPLLARIAREAGALVVVFAILPFTFENQRRQRQARLGLQQLRENADGVIGFANERFAAMLDEKTGLMEVFRRSHEALARGLRGLWRLLTKPGLINVDFAHLCGVMRDRHGESAFATADATGPNRAREVVDQLIKSPLLDQGKLLDEAGAILVSIAGGPELSLAEVNRLMEPFNRRCAAADVVVGAIIDPALEGRLEVTLIVARRGLPAEEAEKRSDQLLQEALLPPPAGTDLGVQLKGQSAPPPPPPRYLPPPPQLTPQEQERYLDRQAGIAAPLRKVLRQGQLPLEVIPKGRFERSQPTIHEGVDLDLPTFRRRGIVLN